MPRGKRRRRSGYVALVGRTNVGKSTFLNAIMERKVAIVSDKPQTTRKRILGIKTTARGQMIFFDCPGVHKPHFRLNERMMKEVNQALLDADLILYFIDIADERPDDFVLGLVRQAAKPAFLVINKIDRFNKARILGCIERNKDLFSWKEIVPISALAGDNLPLLESLILDNLPPGEDFYGADQVTLQSESEYLGELIREKILQRVRDELPYTTAVRIEEVADRGEVVYVRAEILVETHSQKKIMVGHHGDQIKAIGQNSRGELEEYLGKKVYLDLTVRVAPDWRDSPRRLKEIFG